MTQSVQNDHGMFYAPAQRSRLFTASIGAAGVAPGTALGTAPPLTLWNPANSGRLLSITRVRCGYISGTLGAGSIVHAFNPAQALAPTSGTELAPVTNTLTLATGNVGRAWTGATISATATMFRAAFMLGAALASSVSFPIVAEDLTDGEIIVPPGVAWCLQGIAAAGTSPLVLLAVTWEEISGALAS